MSDAIRIRPAKRADVPTVFALIVELADYERAADRVTGGERMLDQALFGPDPSAEALIAELDGQTVGFALFYRTFSTWLCRPGMWLEDLYVSPSHRRAGLGRLLLGELARISVQRGYGRLEWSALHWNTPAITFYESLGAKRQDEWEGFRVEDAQLKSLARALDRVP